MNDTICGRRQQLKKVSTPVSVANAPINVKPQGGGCPREID